MSKKSSDKYCQEKKRIQKQLVKDNKILLKEKGKKAATWL